MKFLCIDSQVIGAFLNSKHCLDENIPDHGALEHPCLWTEAVTQLLNSLSLLLNPHMLALCPNLIWRYIVRVLQWVYRRHRCKARICEPISHGSILVPVGNHIYDIGRGLHTLPRRLQLRWLR